MALQKQPININFSQGIQTKIDPFQLPIGQFQSLTNTVFTKDGLQTKRNGFPLLTAAPTGAQTLCTLNSALVMLGQTCQSYNSDNQQLTSNGIFQPMKFSTAPMVRRATSQLNCDIAVSPNDLACSVWKDADGSCYYQICDANSGQIVVPAVALVSGAAMPRVFVIGNTFIVTYLVTSGTVHLQYILIPTSTTLTPTSPVDITTQANTISAAYDGVVANNMFYLSVFTTVGGGGIVSWDFTLPQLLSANITIPTVTAVASADLISVSVDTSNVGFPIFWTAFYRSSQTSVYAFALNNDLSTNLGITTISTGVTVNELTSLATNNILTVYYEVQNTYSFSGVKSDYLAQNTLTLTGTAGTASTILRGVGLAAKAVYSNSMSKVILLATYGQAFQPTYFLIDTSGNVLLRFAYSNGIGYLANQIMPSINQSTDGTLRVGYLFADLLQAVSKAQGASTAGVYAQYGINLATIIPSGQTQALEIGGSLHVTGGMLWQHDGVKIREHGFHVWPEDVTAIGARGQTPGSLTVGQGQMFYQAVYEWTDAAGMIHRSAPSIPTSFQVLSPSTFTGTTAISSNQLTAVSSFTNLQVGQGITGTGIPVATYILALNPGSSSLTMSQNATSNNTGETITPSAVSNAQINIPTLRQTYKTTNKVRIVLYRWTTTQQVYYRVTSISNPLLNDTTVDFVSYTDGFADSTIIGNDIIYTNGGVIEDICAPAAKAMTLWQSRLFMTDAEDPNLIWYSKQVIEATPIEMSDLLTIFIAPTIGAQGSSGSITALSSMDDKLIIFKEDAIYYIIGQGPDNTGANNGFSDPVFITGTVGCSNVQSLILTSDGIMFQSDKGIWLLGRDLSTNYIGAAVEGYTQGQTVTSALCIPSTNQVRFTLDNNTAVVYDYFFKRWSNWNQTNAISSTLYQGMQTYLNPYGQVVQESVGNYIDTGGPVLLGLKTGWINIAGVQGLERFYEMYLLGVYYTPFKLEVKLAFDYNSSAAQSTIVVPDNYSPAYGGDALWGGSSPWGGPGNVFSSRVFPDQQKCTAFQVEINELYDPSLGVNPGAGLTFSGMNLVVGMKRGYRTNKASTNFG